MKLTVDSKLVMEGLNVELEKKTNFTSDIAEIAAFTARAAFPIGSLVKTVMRRKDSTEKRYHIAAEDKFVERLAVTEHVIRAVVAVVISVPSHWR